MLKFKKRTDIKYDVTHDGKKIGEVRQVEGFKPVFGQSVKIWIWSVNGSGNNTYSTTLDNCKKALQRWLERITHG